MKTFENCFKVKHNKAEDTLLKKQPFKVKRNKTDGTSKTTFKVRPYKTEDTSEKQLLRWNLRKQKTLC